MLSKAYILRATPPVCLTVYQELTLFGVEKINKKLQVQSRAVVVGVWFPIFFPHYMYYR